MLTDEKIHRIFAPVLMHDLPLSKLPKTYPWTEVLANSIKLSPTAAKLMGLTFSRGAIFTGSAGNGRHTSAWALANTLVEKAGYASVCTIHGRELDLEDLRDLDTIAEYLEKLVLANTKLVLILDGPEDSVASHSLQEQLILLQKKLLQNKNGLFLITVADSADCVSPAMMRQFPCYHCPNPDHATVKEFVNNFLKVPVPLNLDGIAPKEVLEHLQGCSWKQLTDFHTQLLRLLVSTYQANESTQYKDVSEEEAYKKGLVVLPKQKVKAILSAASAQKPQVAMVPMVQQVISGSDPVPKLEQKPEKTDTLENLTIPDDENLVDIPEISGAIDPVRSFQEFTKSIPSST